MATLAITGASGQLGTHVLSNLATRNHGHHIVALRRTAPADVQQHIETRIADYDASDTLMTALKGVDRLLLISGNDMGKRYQQHKAVIDAAVGNGVQHITYTSVLRADTSTLSIAPEHAQTERYIQDSGVAYTILRNGWYTENYLAGIPSALTIGTLYGAAGDGRISSATRQDYARAAVESLLGNAQSNHIYELAGDEPYTLSMLAETLSNITGKHIPYSNLSESDYSAALTTAGFRDFVAEMFASFDTAASRGELYSESKDLQQLIGGPTTSLEDALREAVK